MAMIEPALVALFTLVVLVLWLRVEQFRSEVADHATTLDELKRRVFH